MTQPMRSIRNKRIENILIAVIFAIMGLGVFILVVCVTVFPVVSGCGQLQPGRERTINFAVTNFNLPAAMVYYESQMAKIQVPTIATSKSEAETFVRRLINESVEDVLYEQGRSAFLPDSVISSILQQLNVQITYEPLKCENVVTMLSLPNMPNMNGAVQTKLNCIIIDGTVRNTCIDTAMNAPKCTMMMNFMNFKTVGPKYLSIPGSLKTSNVIMANWSNQMWESVLNRVLRRISSGSSGSYFYGASVKIS